MRLEHVVTGWTRGGLGYVTKLLKASGCDVGTTFDADTTKENLEQKLQEARTVEVSPYLVPFLPFFRSQRATFILRDPMRVLNSLYFHGFFHGERHSDVAHFAFKHLPGFEYKFKGKPGQAGCSYLWNWLKAAKSNHAGLEQIRVEEGPAKIRRHFNLPASDRYVEPYTNASYCRQIIIPSDLPPHSKTGMVSLLIQLGYREAYWSPRGGHAHYVNPDWHC